ncbi:hypothetical protein [Mycobacterium sp. HUMS_1102779]|uniref:hypothetical protein n=1 Tax=Mycobacterium sp. HUMS_1102779 TaxID=3383487 RepID=UPI00389AA5DE
MTETLVISDRFRSPISVRRRTDAEGGIVIRNHRHAMLLSRSELDRLIQFVHGPLQRYVAPKAPLSATQGDE